MLNAIYYYYYYLQTLDLSINIFHNLKIWSDANLSPNIPNVAELGIYTVK